MSANHGQSKAKAIEIIHAMKESGADAVKLQTYTPDTMTINCDRPSFVDCLKGTLWEGQTLHALYGTAFTPWEWQPDLKKEAEKLGMDCFSTAFDETSVDFLEAINVPAYKIASFELVHLPLLRKVASTGKPLIISTGMGTRDEINDAVTAARMAGATEIALLKCTSAYPAEIADANVRSIPAISKDFGVPVGLSDHTLGSAVPVAAITQGACIIEKHFTLDRKRDAGPDSAFSMEPREFREMVEAVRLTESDIAGASIDERALGTARYGTTNADKGSVRLRPSIFAVADIRTGEEFSSRNVRVIRPGYGLAPKELPKVLGKHSTVNIPRGTPLSWELVG